MIHSSCSANTHLCRTLPCSSCCCCAAVGVEVLKLRNTQIQLMLSQHTPLPHAPLQQLQLLLLCCCWCGGNQAAQHANTAHAQPTHTSAARSLAAAAAAVLLLVWNCSSYATREYSSCSAYTHLCRTLPCSSCCCCRCCCCCTQYKKHC